MQANNIGRGRVTQQGTGRGIEYWKLRERGSDLWEKPLSTIAIQTHHELQSSEKDSREAASSKWKGMVRWSLPGKSHSNVAFFNNPSNCLHILDSLGWIFQINCEDFDGRSHSYQHCWVLQLLQQLRLPHKDSTAVCTVLSSWWACPTVHML